MKAHVFAVLAVFTAVGCGGGDAEYREVMPQVESLTLEVTGDPSEGATAQGRQPGTVSQGLGNLDAYLKHARAAARQVNESIRLSVGTARELLEATEGENLGQGRRRYGPKDLGNVTYRLFIRKESETAYGWLLEAKPLGAEDSAYLRVAAGAVARARDGGKRGILGFNADNYKLADPSFPGGGRVLTGYGVRADGTKTLAYRLDAFSPDLSVYPATSASFVGFKRAEDGGTAVRIATWADDEDVAQNTPAKELIRIRARWLPGTGGRAAALATGGDIPAGEGYTGAVCWTASLVEQYRLVRHCTGLGSSTRTCTTISETGDRTQCPGGDRAEEPPLDEREGSQETDAPEGDVRPPPEEPTGDRG